MHDTSISSRRAKSTLDNRRRCTRLLAQHSASIHARDGVLQAMGELCDVSADGLSVRTDQPPEVGERVIVHVLTNGKIEAVTGKVVHISVGDQERPVVGIHCSLIVLQGQELLATALGLSVRVS